MDAAVFAASLECAERVPRYIYLIGGHASAVLRELRTTLMCWPVLSPLAVKRRSPEPGSGHSTGRSTPTSARCAT